MEQQKKTVEWAPLKTRYTCVVIVTEIIRWLIIVGVLYLNVWQYCEIDSYNSCVFGSVTGVAEFWGIFTGIIVGISVVVYLPLRILFTKLRNRYGLIKDRRWRPSIVLYILLSAVPSFVIIGVVSKIGSSNAQKLQPVTITTLEMIVMGLVLTEWMAKIREELFTFELLTAMILDFFFAYDVIAFILICAYNIDVYRSNWAIASFVFAILAMFKYVPTQPVEIWKRSSSIGHVVCIFTSLVCNDFPFVIIRLSTMITFGFLISDLIFLLKNIFVITFNFMQLGVIYYNVRKQKTESARRMRNQKRHFWNRHSRNGDPWVEPIDDDPSESRTGTHVENEAYEGAQDRCSTVSSISSNSFRHPAAPR